MFAVDRENAGLFFRGQPHDQWTGHDQAFLVGQGHRFAGFQGGPSSLQTGTSDDCRKHHVDLRVAHRPGNSLPADQHLDAFRQVAAIDLSGLFGVGEHDPSGAETNGLLAQEVDVVMCRKDSCAQLAPRIGDNLQRISPDASR